MNVIEKVRAALRPGGKPAAIYLEEGTHRALSFSDARELTEAIFLNWEERIVALEREAGMLA